MIPKTLLNKDIASILSSKGADEFYKGEFSFKGRFRENAEVIYEDRAVGYSNIFIMSARDFLDAKIKLKEIITHKETLKNYQIIQVLTETNNTIKRLILQEVDSSRPTIENNLKG